MKITDFPKKDLPPDVDLKRLKRTDIKADEASHYYYGIGVPVDYARARRLAFMEMAALGDQAGPLEGATILMMLYANGFGVERNLDISIRLACANVKGAGAEVEGRLERLAAMKSGISKEVFDICDDATSGYLTGYCASIRSELADLSRKATLDSITKNWPGDHRLAYARLQNAAAVFFDQRLNSEVDMSGTARVAIAVDEDGSLEDGFRENIIQADKCVFTNYSLKEFAEADRQLNAVYSKIMSDKAFKFGTVTREGIRSTQRKWLEYREAWVAFGTVRCPQMTDAAWRTLITNERITQLQDLLDQYL